MTAIAIIPARGGSKGIPGKNIIDFCGQPLIDWTIDAALHSGCFDLVVVSTDDADIANASREAGADVLMRPAAISGDDASSMSAVLHVLDHYAADTVALLQPTSPLRTADDIAACFDLHATTGRPVVSVTPAKPWLFTATDGELTPAIPVAQQRQAAEMVAPNGAVYVVSAKALKDGRTWWDNPAPYLMPQERSVDIDTPFDLLVARSAFKPPYRPAERWE